MVQPAVIRTVWGILNCLGKVTVCITTGLIKALCNNTPLLCGLGVYRQDMLVKQYPVREKSSENTCFVTAMIIFRKKHSQKNVFLVTIYL